MLLWQLNNQLFITLEAMRTQGARKTMTRPRLLKAGRIVTLRPAISAPAKGLVDVLECFISFSPSHKKASLPCAHSGASLHTAGDESSCASFIPVVREIRRQGPFPSNDRAWRVDRRD